MREKLATRLEELKAARQKFTEYANSQLAHMTGQIELLEDLLKEEEGEE